MNNTATSQRGGPRIAPEPDRRAKVMKVKRILDEGYGIELACKRARTTSATIRSWAKDLNIKLRTL
jgi:hypothetical protein